MNLRKLLPTVLVIGFGVLFSRVASAVTVSENFDSDPANWTSNYDPDATNPSGVNFSNTNNASGTSGAGEAFGDAGENDTFEYYADTTNIDGLTGSDPLSSSGRFYFDITGTGSIAETFFGYFDLDETDIRNDGLGFSLKDENTTTARIRPEARFNGSGLDTSGQVTLNVADQSTIDWEFTYDPSANGGNGAVDYTWTLVSGTLDGNSTPGHMETTTMNLSTNPGSAYDAFGWGSRTRGSDQVAEAGMIAFDDLSYTAAIPEPSTYALCLLGVIGLGWLARRRRK